MNLLMNISEAVATHARLSPQKLGARDSKRQLTYEQWDKRATQLANGLRGLGLQKGDKVALLAYNCLEWIEIYAALARAGLVAVPINFRLTSPEIEYIAKDCEAVAFIVQDELIERVEPIKSQLNIANKTYVGFGQKVPPHWTDYENLIAAAPAFLQHVEVMPADMSALMYTSGTTGKPKGVIRSHEGSTMIALATAIELGFTSADTSLLVMPMCHANSLNFFGSFAYAGAVTSIYSQKNFDPELCLDTFDRLGTTFTSLVPTHYIMLMSLPLEVRTRYDVSAVGKLLISSAPARPDTKRGIMELFPNGKLYELYGSTEAGWVTLLRPEEQLSKLGSVGREWACSGAIQLLDEHGQEVADGDVGELYSRTSYVFDGYWKNPEKTAEAFAGEWCSVGDMARRDSDGYIWLVDRKSNMIISGGENVYPSEVENVLGAFPGVRDVAVIGLPDEDKGAVIHAILEADPSKVGEDELKAFLAERLVVYKIPRTFEFTDEAVRDDAGKVRRSALRAERSEQYDN